MWAAPSSGRRRRAERPEAARLGLPAAAPVVVIDRVRSADGRPLLVERLVLPGRLGAAFIDREGARAVPVMLHHAVLGSMGRFIGILLEHHRGRLPFRFAPDQVAILPVSDGQSDAARAFRAQLLAAGLRPILLEGAETLSRRLVMAHERLIPVHAVIGKREASASEVSLQEGGSRETVGVSEAVKRLSARAA